MWFDVYALSIQVFKNLLFFYKKSGVKSLFNLKYM